MNGITLLIIIIFGLIGLFALYKILKPYFLRYDSTLCFTGGLGSGKSLSTIKTAIVLLRKNRFLRYKMYNFWKVKIPNFFISRINKRHNKYNLKHTLLKDGKRKKLYQEKLLRKKPMLYSNIPIHFKKHIFSRDREWNITLTAPHILCLEEIREYSVVVIDELPQFINQFNLM